MTQAAETEPGTAIDTRQAENPPAPQTESAAILSIIERMAVNPQIDPDRIERYMDMYDRMEGKKAEQAFNAAMNAAQIEMGPVAANQENTQTRSRYADYAQLDRVLRPIYTRHGFSISFDEGDTDKPDHIRVLAYVSHRDGFTRTYRKDMPADGKGAKGGDVMTKTHASGAADSYGMRYLLKKIFNVSVGEDDTDGNMPADAISEKQVERIRDLIDQANADIAAFCQWMGVEALPDIAARDFKKAETALLGKISKGNG